MQWRLKKDGEFDICSFYNALRGPSLVFFPCLTSGKSLPIFIDSLLFSK